MSSTVRDTELNQWVKAFRDGRKPTVDDANRADALERQGGSISSPERSLMIWRKRSEENDETGDDQEEEEANEKKDEEKSMRIRKMRKWRRRARA
eukprot:8830727-Pyramimonas_sp.AAC.1